MKAVMTILILSMTAMFFIVGCSSDPQVKEGDIVRVEYVGTLEDGSTFDSSEGRDPLQFTVGSGQMIPGFDKGVMGMKVGETKEITLAPEDAYGYPTDDRVMEVDKSQFPPDLELEEGMELVGPGGFPVKVKAISDSVVTIDANHPMAGKTLNFELTLVEIVDPESVEQTTPPMPQGQPQTEPEAQPEADTTG